MTYLKKKLLPLVFGFFVYSLIRLINDSISGTKFWQRSWATNLIELGTVILISYALFTVLTWRIQHFNQALAKEFKTKKILAEIGELK